MFGVVECNDVVVEYEWCGVRFGVEFDEVVFVCWGVVVVFLECCVGCSIEG